MLFGGPCWEGSGGMWRALGGMKFSGFGSREVGAMKSNIRA